MRSSQSWRGFETNKVRSLLWLSIADRMRNWTSLAREELEFSCSLVLIQDGDELRAVFGLLFSGEVKVLCDRWHEALIESLMPFSVPAAVVTDTADPTITTILKKVGESF